MGDELSEGTEDTLFQPTPPYVRVYLNYTVKCNYRYRFHRAYECWHKNETAKERERWMRWRGKLRAFKALDVP